MEASVEFWFAKAKAVLDCGKAPVESGEEKLRSVHSRKTASSVIIDIQHHGEEARKQNQVQRVPPLFRKRLAHTEIYDPVIISIGPYHHNKKELSHAQLFKEQFSLKVFLSESRNSSTSFFKEKLLMRIGEIRGCYDQLPAQLIDDDSLVKLILHDACFLIYYMELTTKSSLRQSKFSTFYTYFGPARIRFIFRDLILLENQIPFWILEFLLCLQSDKGQSIWKDLLCKFMNVVFYGEAVGTTSLPWADKNIEPFHFLEAYYETLKVDIPISPNASTSGISIGERNPNKSNSYRFRSITNLKAKGVQFKLSKTQGSEEVIKFTSSYFWGTLNLPALFFSTNFFVIYSNLIAYEMFPTNKTDFFVSSLVNLLKSLIESPNDVKILREKGILFNDMVTDDHVVKVIKDLDSFGLENIGTFLELRDCIETHCCKKRWTWIAELIHNNFENPWKATALFAAICILVLTFLQTFFTIRPVKK